MKTATLICLLGCCMSGCSTAENRAVRTGRQLDDALPRFMTRYGRTPRNLTELQVYASPDKPLDLSCFKSIRYRRESRYSAYLDHTP